MPVVKIDLWKLKSDEEKEKIIKGITKTFVEIGMKPEWVTVIINEVDKENWGSGGEQASKK